MARPRIFISSTFYDLRQIREDIDRAIKELGYEPIRHETGAIAYGKDERPESSAYREVDLCDVLVAIIGGRYGSESRAMPGSSVTQNEIKRALERGVQVFIFIEKSVLSEHGFYGNNKDVKDVKYRHVDNVKVFEFLDHIMALPQNNAMAPFEIAADITTYLREQFAGLFQRFLQAKRREEEINTIGSLRSIAATLNGAVEYLTSPARSREGEGKEELLEMLFHVNSPVFARLASLTNTAYRVYFTNQREMDVWLKAKGWRPMSKESYDADSVAEYSNPQQDGYYLKLTKDIFDDKGKLVTFAPGEWDDNWIKSVPIVAAASDPSLSDDDIPF